MLRLALVATMILALPVLAQIEDHMEIEGPFESGPAVTAVCLDCHDDAAADFMMTTHWTWSSEQEIEGQDCVVDRGKINAVNNFCISVPGNWPRCTSCHAGYGWIDDSFDFSDPAGIDCLVCHDTTGSYKKFPTAAGHPVYEAKEFMGKTFEVPDLENIARNVGMPDRASCGSCHFFGGGGNAVKHGDLDNSLINPARTLDVHMGIDGENMTCQECHKTESHQISGNALVVSPGGNTHIDCVDCHEGNPHTKKAKFLGKHLDKVACQTCHIPSFAKEAPTKTWWDWSDAGKDREGRKDENGKSTFAKKKGSFTWEKNITPVYAWYNGRADAYLFGDKMDPSKVTSLNWPLGERSDEDAKIFPFKLMRGKQPYDSENKVFITPKLFGKTGYWKTFDWNSAAEQGMKLAGLDYSGSYDFAETEMYWKINHMVSPKEDALKCKACHSEGGLMDWEALGYPGDPKKKENRD
jgi:octaheme c-type cytochrome (tetrathionate reductase family)